MTINFRCPHCRYLVSAPDNGAGKKGRCPKCSRSIQIPSSDDKTSHPAGRSASPTAASERQSPAASASTQSHSAGVDSSGVSTTSDAPSAVAVEAPATAESTGKRPHLFPLVVLGAVVVLALGGGMGIYFALVAGPKAVNDGSQVPGAVADSTLPVEIREARALYRDGKYHETYAAALAYIGTKDFEADFVTAMQGEARANGLGVHPEAFFLAAEVGLLHLSSWEQVHLQLLKKATEIDAAYQPRAAALLKMAAERIIDQQDFDREKLVANVATACQPVIDMEVFDVLDSAVTSALKEQKAGFQPPTALLTELRGYDAAAADALAQRAEVRRKLDEALRGDVAVALMPTLVTAFRKITDEDLKKCRIMSYEILFEHVPEFLEPVYARKSLSPDARALFLELRRCCMLRYPAQTRRAFGMHSGEGIEAWGMLIDLARHQRDELWPLMLEDMTMNGDVALAFLARVPPFPTGNDTRSKMLKPIVQFDQALGPPHQNLWVNSGSGRSPRL
jgi:hypothetical protein